MVAHWKLYISHHRRRDGIPGADAGALRGAGGRSKRSFTLFSVLLLVSHFRFSFVQRSCSRSVCDIKQFISGFAFLFGFVFRFRFGFRFSFGSGFGCRSFQRALRRSLQGWDSGLPSAFCVLSTAFESAFLHPYSAFLALSSSLSLLSAVLSAPVSASASASSAFPAFPASPASPSPSASAFLPRLLCISYSNQIENGLRYFPTQNLSSRTLDQCNAPRLKHETNGTGRI